MDSLARFVLRLVFRVLVEVVKSAVVRGSFGLPAQCRECVALILQRVEEDLRAELGMRGSGGRSV